MSDFFPFVGVEDDYKYNTNDELPYLAEFDYNFETNEYIIDENTNDFKLVYGKEAIKVWIYKALLTNRYEHEVYSFKYGTELITLVGQKFSRGLTESEAFRYIKEALMVNKYITDVENKGITFKNDDLMINIKVKTIYGEVMITDVRRENS